MEWAEVHSALLYLAEENWGTPRLSEEYIALAGKIKACYIEEKETN